ncbi:hypothetical protein [Actinoplanes sp. N902-109]|uniref:hypothetical protein n=1 Tax=Actinoplanes sp. (strain N902-109) TaxID=649831 RepID=UPI0005A02731|nr:hypothetical protein [Actinoplanes sp. N902-109]
MSDTAPEEPAAVWFGVPDGYAPLPLHDLTDTMSVTYQLIQELGTDEQRALSGTALGALAVYLGELAERGAVYCGIGRHVSETDGSPVTSSLVVTLQEYPGRRNPRLLLRDVAEGKRRAGEHGHAELVDLPNGPALFVERELLLPAPPRPGDHVLTVAAEAPVWQLEAFLPGPDGDRLAVIEVSTPFVAAGPQFRPMTVAMAAALSFRPPADQDPLASLLG